MIKVPAFRGCLLLSSLLLLSMVVSRCSRLYVSSSRRINYAVQSRNTRSLSQEGRALVVYE
jgi:hypothetical protein